jgi:hypothetical protein
MDQLTLSSSSFLDSGVSLFGDNVTVVSNNGGNLRTVVTNSTFTGTVGGSFGTSDNIQVDASGTGRSDFDISNSSFSGGGQTAINVSAAGTGFATYNVHDNPLITARAAVGINVAVNESSTMRGFIQNNSSIYSTVANNPAAAINVVVDQNGLGVVDINNNVITSQPGQPQNGFQMGIRGMARNAPGSTLDINVRNNVVSVADSPTNGFEGITLDAGNSSPGESPVTVRVNFSNNSIDGHTGFADDYVLTQYAGNTFGIQGLNVTGTNAAAVAGFVAATDTDANPTDPTVNTQGGLVVNYTNAGPAAP